MLKTEDVAMPILKKNRKRLSNDNREGMDGPSIDRRRVSCTIHPLLQGPQQLTNSQGLPIRLASKSCLTEFTQRVMSAKLLQLKNYQSQLTEAQMQLHMAREENKALTRLLKRHEAALTKYEGDNAGMPRLLRSHAEEVRTFRITVHQLKTELRQVHGQLRDKEAEIVTLKDTVTQLRSLADHGQLFDRAKERKKIEELQALVEEQNREIQLLSRRMLLETKNHQRQLHTEVSKQKQTRKSLESALETIETLQKQTKSVVNRQTASDHPYRPSDKKSEKEVAEIAVPNRNTARKQNPTQVTVSGAKMAAFHLPETVVTRPHFRPDKRLATPTI